MHVIIIVVKHGGNCHMQCHLNISTSLLSNYWDQTKWRHVDLPASRECNRPGRIIKCHSLRIYT